MSTKVGSEHVVTALRFINEFELCSLEITQKLSSRLALCLAPPDTILLKGPLGAGKTEFARALVRALLGPETVVQSPTFPLILPYDTPKGLLWHVDLYRLSADEASTLGITEHWRHHMTLLEWPEHLAARPNDYLELHFSLDEIRKVALNGTIQWQSRLDHLRGACL